MSTERHDGRDHEASLHAIAGAVADHEEIDWGATESATREEYRPLIRLLELISRVSETHHRDYWPDESSPHDAASSSLYVVRESWGPLQIIERVGAGMFGEIYRARDPQLDREVALKLFYTDRLGRARPAKALIEEGRLLARVRHPNVAVVHGAEEHDDRVGIWMEFVEGATLEEYVNEKGPLDPDEAMAIGRDVCCALGALHEAEIVHRDIKASNVMREESGRIVLLDLGASRDASRLDSGGLYGTPYYAAPEVLIENASSPASDLYSVGVLLFFMVTGRYPVEGASVRELREAHAAGRVRPLKEVRPDVPVALARVVARALSPEPEARFASAQEFEEALGDALQAKARARKRLARSLALVAVLAVVVGAWIWGPWRSEPPPDVVPGRIEIPPFVKVDAQCNVFAAGHDHLPGGTGLAPVAIDLPSSPETYVEFVSVSGLTSCCGEKPDIWGEPDGSDRIPTDIESMDGVSGITHESAFLFLAGVFLDDAEPSDPAPDRRHYTAANIDSLSYRPELAQTFFIGDGKDSAGNTQRFYAPPGATRLFLGFADAMGVGSPGAYTGNDGALELCGTIVFVPEGGSASSPQYGHGPDHTGFNPDENKLGPSNVGDLEIAWIHSTPCSIRGQVSVVDGVAHYGHYCGEARAVDAATGRVIWSRSFPGKHQGQAIVDGVAYVSSTNNDSGPSSGTLFAFDAATGETIWSWHVDARRFGGPVVADGLIYLNSSGDSPEQMLHVLDAGSGAELWSLAGVTAPTVADDLLFVNSWPSSELQARDRSNGDLLWSGETDGGQLSGQCVADGRVYVHSISGYLYAFEATRSPGGSRAPIWYGATQPQGEGFGSQSPSAAYGRVFVGAGDTFYAFDAEGCGTSPCAPTWTASSLCSFFGNKPTIANGVVYTTCGNNYLNAFDATSGAELWSFYTPGDYPLRSSPTIIDGRLFHPATFEFKLYVFE